MTDTGTQMGETQKPAWDEMSLLEKSDALCMAAEYARIAGDYFASLAIAAKAAQYIQMHRLLNETS